MASGGPRITIVGGGSNQWAPKLVVDFVNMPSLHGAEIVLEDIDARNLSRVAAFVEHCARLRGIPMTVSTTTNQRAALDGADFVVVSISTGGFDSMRHDLEVPARYGIRQTVGDTVGPGGIARGLRNIPVLVGIARDMEARCPDAWLLNLTNPMTTLCQAVVQETSIRTIGLCHEVTILSFFLSLMLGVRFLDLDPTVTGLNHLPIMTSLDCAGEDGLARLRTWLDDPPDLDAELPFDLTALGMGKPAGDRWTKRDLIAMNRVKFELFERFGVLPAAGDRHLVEFFPGFLGDEDVLRDRWGVELTTIDERRTWERVYSHELDELLAANKVSQMPSGENVAGVIDSLLGGKPRNLPLNIPNAGQVLDLPDDVVVESICTVDGYGVRGRDVARAPLYLSDHLRRVSTSQQLVIRAARTGDRDTVFAAMLADPLAGRLPYDEVGALTDDLLAATAAWLPQFSHESPVVVPDRPASMVPPALADKVDQVLARAAAWVAGRPDVRALALVGSWARGTATVESDVDLMLLTEDPAPYTGSDVLVRGLGAGDLVRTRTWGPVTERRLALRSGLEVEVGVALPTWAAVDPVDEGTRRVVGCGMRVLYDPDGLLAGLVAALSS